MGNMPLILCLQLSSSMRGVRSARLLEKLGYETLTAYFSRGESLGSFSDEYGLESIDISEQPWSNTISWGPLKYSTFRSMLGEEKGRKMAGLLFSLYPNGLNGVLRKLGKDYDIDLVHVLGYPDGQIIPVKDSLDLPAIFDFRDLSTGISLDTLKRNFDNSFFRNTGLQDRCARYQKRKWEDHEKAALSISDGVIFSSKDMREELLDRNPGIEPEKWTVLENRPFIDDIPKEPHERISQGAGQTNIVYIGAIGSSGYRDYRNYFKQVLDGGFALHVYTPSSKEIQDSYFEGAGRSKDLHFHDPLPPGEILKEITRYDYGMVPFDRSRDTDHLDYAIPNKLYEYLACGLRVITSPIKTASRIVTELDGGMVIEEGKDLADQIRSDIEVNGGKGRAYPLERYCHESQIEGLKALLEKVHRN